MTINIVRVPEQLLRDPDLTASAKLVWMVARIQSHLTPSSATLEAGTGLSRPTVLRGLARLAAAGWYSLPPHMGAIDTTTAGANVTLPAERLTERSLGIQARVLYCVLHLTPGFRNRSGQFTYASLVHLTRASPNTLKLAVKHLVKSGWLQTSQSNQLNPVLFTIANPIAARGQAEVARAKQRVAESAFIGEALMREYLSLIVDSDDFEDDAAPGFLVNPMTDKRMELDRFYPLNNVAVEFNGPQHYGPTERFSQTDSDRQRGRDNMKVGICQRRGISVLEIQPADLTLEAISQKIGQLLPMRNLNGHEPLIKYLESASRGYRLAAKRQTRP